MEPEPNVGPLPLSDHQKLEREARICRLLKHPNIGKHTLRHRLPRPHHPSCGAVGWALGLPPLPHQEEVSPKGVMYRTAPTKRRGDLSRSQLTQLAAHPCGRSRAAWGLFLLLGCCVPLHAPKSGSSSEQQQRAAWERRWRGGSEDFPTGRPSESSLLQKSCFRKTPEPLQKTKIGKEEREEKGKNCSKNPKA